MLSVRCLLQRYGTFSSSLQRRGNIKYGMFCVPIYFQKHLPQVPSPEMCYWDWAIRREWLLIESFAATFFSSSWSFFRRKRSGFESTNNWTFHRHHPIRAFLARYMISLLYLTYTGCGLFSLPWGAHAAKKSMCYNCCLPSERIVKDPKFKNGKLFPGRIPKEERTLRPVYCCAR